MPPAPTPRLQPSVIYRAPRLAAPGVAVTAAEVDFFVANGFLVKHGLVDESAADIALGRVWAHLLDRVPRQAGWQLRREDPSTWTGPRWGPVPPTPKAGPHAGRLRIEHLGTTVKLHDLGSASHLLRLVPNDPAVREVATALLGELRPSSRTRGVYAVFPKGAGQQEVLSSKAVAAALTPHTDRVCQQLNVCVYLDDVPPRNGGFTLYPGSHRTMFQAHRYHANWSPTPSYRTAVAQVVADTQPVELAAAKGDAIFWHGRTVHSAGAHFGDRVRWAIFADFTHDRPVLTEDEHRAVGQFEWFKDAKLFREDALVGAGEPSTDGNGTPAAPQADARQMWRGWRLGGYDSATAGTEASRRDLCLVPFNAEARRTRTP